MSSAEDIRAQRAIEAAGTGSQVDLAALEVLGDANAVENVDAVLSAEVAVTGTLVAATAGRLKAVSISSLAVVGDVVFRDGGAGGSVILTINSAAAIENQTLPIPAGGIAFATDLHVTFGATVATSVTVIHR